MSPRDAAELEVSDGDTIIVSSRHGAVTRAIQLKAGLILRHIFVPTGVNDNEAINLFGLSDLTIPGAKGWKTCAVKITKA
jgi:anaerobic selenocysteine-containing dehydrogenase